VEQADADRRHTVAHDADRGAVRHERINKRDIGAIDRGRARAAVRFEDVAVDPERPFAEADEVGYGPQAAADEALNLDAAAVDLPAAVARLAWAGAAGQHVILGREPALALAYEKWRHRQLDRAGTKHGGATHAHEDAAGGGAGAVALKS